ncbi:hypothetical protein RND81_11G054200 [Saponaria officinalis]|uniref:HAT C-terminal dimerisation domain-containing protein n=1 Tax=Saponaria officinalis TaxID=3572 RepID=A0AAW1HI86_SAPOF
MARARRAVRTTARRHGPRHSPKARPDNARNGPKHKNGHLAVALIAKCRYCGVIYTAQSKNGTGHLIRHMDACKHRLESDQRSMDEFLNKPNAPEQYTYNYDECTAELSRMIIQTEEPFLLAEHNAFNLTADAWDSGCDYSYVCITAHWIDREWNLQKRIISFSKLEFPHNAINMHNIIINSICEYNLKSKILSVTFDNATAMTSVANMLKTSLESVLLDDGLEGLKQYHEQFKHVVLHLNSCKWRRQEWRNYCKSEGVKYRKFPLENNTRWNSMYIMLSACIEYKEHLTGFWNSVYPDNRLLDTHWNNMEMYTTSPYFLANIIPIAQLFDKYRGVESHSGFLPKMEKKFLKYWTDIPYIYCLNSSLNRPSSHAGASSSGRAFAGAALNKLKGLVSQLRQDVAQSTSATSDLAEYHMYINYDYMRSFSEDKANVLDLLGWWRGQRRQLPVMSAMAQDFLSAQVSSVASDRAFSASKRVLDEKRTSLRSDTFEMCVCYKDWMDADDRMQGTENQEDENSNDETSTESTA